MKNKKRALRRHHANRMMRKVSNYYAAWCRDDREQFARYHYNHAALCSCEGCGNPRKHFGEKTMQERKADERYKFDLKSLRVNTSKEFF